MKLKQYIAGLAMSDADVAIAIERASEIRITRKLISYAVEGEPIALPKAQAICDFLSEEYGRKITIADTDMKTI